MCLFQSRLHFVVMAGRHMGYNETFIVILLIQRQIQVGIRSYSIRLGFPLCQRYSPPFLFRYQCKPIHLVIWVP